MQSIHCCSMEYYKCIPKAQTQNITFKLPPSVFLLGNLSRWLPTTPRGSPSRRPTLCSTWQRVSVLSTRTKKLRGAPWRQWPWSQRTSKKFNCKKCERVRINNALKPHVYPRMTHNMTIHHTSKHTEFQSWYKVNIPMMARHRNLFLWLLDSFRALCSTQTLWKYDGNSPIRKGWKHHG